MACGAPDAQPQQDASPPVPSADAVAPSLATVDLIDAGQQPHTPLRIRVQPGQRQTLELVVQVGTGMDMGLQKFDHALGPALAARATLTVRSVDGAGDLTYDVVLDGMRLVEPDSISPELRGAYEVTLTDLSPIRGTVTRSARGVPKQVDLHPTPEMTLRSRHQFQLLAAAVAESVPILPAEPIGIGARWIVHQQIRENDLTIDQVAHVELLTREGDRCRLVLSLHPTAQPQKLNNTILPMAQLELLGLHGIGTATFDIDLTQVAATSADSSARMYFHSHTEETGMRMSVRGSLSIDVTVRAVAPG